MTTTAEDYRPDLVGDGYDTEPLLRAREVAKLLSIPDVADVYDLPIKRIRLSKARLRWRPSDVRDYLDRRSGEFV